jgi:hypothetical protein
MRITEEELIVYGRQIEVIARHLVVPRHLRGQAHHPELSTLPPLAQDHIGEEQRVFHAGRLPIDRAKNPAATSATTGLNIGLAIGHVFARP